MSTSFMVDPRNCIEDASARAAPKRAAICGPPPVEGLRARTGAANPAPDRSRKGNRASAQPQGEHRRAADLLEAEPVVERERGGVLGLHAELERLHAGGRR